MGSIQPAVRSIALALGVVPACASAAGEPLELAAASEWVIDYADDSCALRRSFGASDDHALLELRRFGPGERFQVSLSSSTLTRTNKAPRVKFEPDDELLEQRQALFFRDEEARAVSYSDTLRPTALKRKPGPVPDWPVADRDARERAITGLTVTATFDRTLLLQTGAMHQPMEAMRTCLDELLGHWGLDPAAQRTLSRTARPTNLQNWSRRILAAYPKGMIRNGQSGLVHIRLVVGADGAPSDCIPQKDFSTPGFEEHACELTMRHARFEPALDADGAPIASFYTTTIVYQTF